MYFTISVFDALFGVVCALMLIFGGKLVYICMLYNAYCIVYRADGILHYKDSSENGFSEF